MRVVRDKKNFIQIRSVDLKIWAHTCILASSSVFPRFLGYCESYRRTDGIHGNLVTLATVVDRKIKTFFLTADGPWLAAKLLFAKTKITVYLQVH